MRVERLQQAYEVEIRYRHFPLHPETPAKGLTLEELFAGRNIDIPAAKARMAALMAQEDLPYGERTMTYNSRLAQELAAWAETQPGGDAIHNSLFRAYFVNDMNLADAENLIAAASAAGLSPEAAKEVLRQRTFRDAVDADWQRSRDLGISSVPTFVIGNRGLAGAQPYEQLESFLLESGVDRRGP